MIFCYVAIEMYKVWQKKYIKIKPNQTLYQFLVKHFIFNIVREVAETLNFEALSDQAMLYYMACFTLNERSYLWSPNALL